MTRRGLGYKRDRAKLPHEKRDFLAEALPLPPAAPTASLARFVLDVLDQGQLGYCVPNGGAQAIRCTHVRKGITSPELLSRLFSGYLPRVGTEGSAPADDSGMEIRDFFDSMKTYGFVRESRMPYDVAKFSEKPSPDVERLAFDQRAPAVYYRIADLGEARYDTIRRALTAGYPVVFGCDVTNAFCEGAFDPTKPLHAPTTDIAGGHCMMFAGYEDASSFVVLNSWGRTFGDGGCVRFALDYIDACSDLWIVADAPYFSDSPEAA